MWLNCVFGGIGVGLINMLVYLIIGVFLAGLMVGRTPEYLGKKVEAREMKLAMLALLIHPLLISAADRPVRGDRLGARRRRTTPAPHGFSEILYEFTSASANNGSGFEGLADTYGFNDNPRPVRPHWDIATRAGDAARPVHRRSSPRSPWPASLAAKKPTPFTAGTLRTDTLDVRRSCCWGRSLLVGALLFLPAAVLGPVAEHLGPIPFGR